LDGWSKFLQAWNHDFFWSSIYPGGGGQPDGEVLELIERDFGSFEEFAKEFKAVGVSQFGSGWVWLICKCTTIFVVDSNAFANVLLSSFDPEWIQSRRTCYALLQMGFRLTLKSSVRVQ
jgi:superoxide dismutase